MELQLHTNGDDELVRIMKENMTAEEERIFMISHYLYLKHGKNNKAFVVDFDNVWNNVGFTQKVNAKRLLEKKFQQNIDYQIVFFPKEELHHNQGNGRQKEQILLTMDCFKGFCMFSETEKAKEIRTYFIKIESIMHEYVYARELALKNKNEALKNKNEGLEHKNEALEHALQVSQTETAMKRHEVLIDSNKNKWVVYFCKIHNHEEGGFILKIGETTHIKNRIDALRCDFGANVILLDVFVCENSIKFEKALHNSPELLQYRYKNLQRKNKKFSTEAYHIPNQKEYEKIVKYASAEMSNYNNIEIAKIRIEEKKIDLGASLATICKNYDEVMNILNKLQSPFSSITNMNKNIENETISNNVENESDDHVEEEPANEEIETDNNIAVPMTANATGPIVQTYHKDDLHRVVRVYNSITEATREFNYNNKTASFTAIKKAFLYKTIYLDHRWHFISNRQEPNLHEPRNIGQTVITQEKNQGQVAMLNIDKTKVIKVFELAKDAAKEILQHPSAMCSAIKHSSPLNGHYWLRWENVDASLQDDFLQSNILPNKKTNVRGIKIQQLHPTTNAVIKTFASYTDIQKELKISIKKIKELVENNETYHGKYKFRPL
jgi:phage anti-repressor protein